MIEALKDKKSVGTSEVQTDITKYRRSTQALRELEAKYRTLVEKSLDAIAIVKGDEFVFVNKAFLEMFDYESDEEVIGSRIADFLAPQSRELVRSRGLARERGEEVPVRYEAKAQKKDGTIFDVELSVGLITFQGEIARQGIIRDITQRKKMEEALRESEEKFRLFQSSVFDVIYRYDPQNNRYDFISPSVEQQTGYTVEEFSSCPKEITQRITHPEDWVKVRDEVKRQIARGPSGRPFRIEYRITRKDGKEIWVSDQKTLEFSSEGKLYRINGVVRDITERRRTEEALKNSEERFRTIFETAIDSIFIKDHTLKYIQVNPAMEKLFGLSASKLIGRMDEDLFGKEAGAHIREVDSRVLAGEIIEEEYTKPVRGIPTTFHVIKVPMRNSEGKVVGLCGIARDIAERKRAEEKLKEYTRQIEEKNRELKAKNQELTTTRAQLVQEEKLRALGQMASGVAHNFNNLLAIVLGRAQLLQLKAKELDIEKGLRSIEKAALDASSTIKRIQDFARVRKDQEFKPVNVDQVIEEVIALTKTQWKDQAEANGINIRVEVQKDLHKLPPVAADESGLREVFTNIIFNAVEAMPKGGKIIIGSRTDGKSIFVSFADSGVGIPEKIKQKIFDPFFTTKGVTKTGLGLSAAYGIIQRHRGDIQIESKQGEGTTVVVKLPVSKIFERGEPKGKESERPMIQRESTKILIIEDQKDVRELLFDILSSANYTVKLASGGIEGLEICKKERFDIVFTDLGMPKMSGWEVAKAIKEIDWNTTVFLITGWGVDMDEEKLKESGINRVVTKPIKVETLLDLISETIRARKKTKEPMERSLVHPVEGKRSKS